MTRYLLIGAGLVAGALTSTAQETSGHQQALPTLQTVEGADPAATGTDEATAPDSPEGDFTQAVPFHIPRARWSEDWSILRDADTRHDDFWRPIKFIRLGDRSHLSIGGEARLTYEQYDPANRGLEVSRAEDVGMVRLAAHTDWHLGDWRLFGQLGYAGAGDREDGNKPVDQSRLNVWQLFADYHLGVGERKDLIFRVGRQIIETANTFITAGEANNLRLYHQGLRVALRMADFIAVDVFAAESVDYANGAFEMSGNGEYLWGARASRRLPGSGLEPSVQYLGWSLKDRNFEQGAPASSDEVRHTLMLWLYHPLTVTKRWGLDYYLAYQFGTYEDRPEGSRIHAFGAYGGFEHALLGRVRTPILGLKTSYFSGDSDPNDDELNTFYDAVFGSPYFSYARDVMPYNLIHLQPNVGYRFSKRMRVTLSHDVLWRASTADGFYTDVNTLAVRAEEGRSRFIGGQTQLAAAWKATGHITASMHLVRFWAGDFIREAGGSDQTYLHLGVTYLF